MSYYFLMPFLVLCIMADFVMIRYGRLDDANQGKRLPIILIILFVPLLWLLMKLDNTFHPLLNLFSIGDKTLPGLAIKVLLAVIIILLLEVLIYRLISRFAGKKAKADR